mmetsp:Transcript_9625/g.26165  ORF Transcript_9625/g.26165 Transcript_9625/m.26165 type:complete len:739 (+) Transcript_9625:246-2462(+)
MQRQQPLQRAQASRISVSLSSGRLSRRSHRSRRLFRNRAFQLPHGSAVTRTAEKTETARTGSADAFVGQQVLNVVWLALSQGWERHRGAWEHRQHAESRSAAGFMAEFPPVAPTEPASHVRLQELMEETQVGLDSSLPPNLLPYLRAVGLVELNHLRVMSMMSTLCYGMEKKVNESSMRRLGLDLVTTSIAWEKCLKEATARVAAFQEGVSYGDGMSMNFTVDADLSPEKERKKGPGAKGKHVKHANASQPELDRGHSYSGQTSSPQFVSSSSSRYQIYSSPSPERQPVSRVLSLEYSDADLDVAVVQEPMSPNGRNNISFFGSRGRVQGDDELAGGTSGRGQNISGGTSGSGVVVGSTSSIDVLNQPCAWYVADDTRHDVRYFVIQGSDNLDHWKLNLTFDPVAFEGENLGLKAHRGVYEAACSLYDVFLPLVTDYVASNPQGTVAFTGHSLGGSLGTMLMLMFFHRGVLRAANLAPVHTFGSPAVFCGGEGCSGGCSVNGGEGQMGVLDRLGLPHDAIRNVIMHNDIVPRAFACDYSILADLLKRIHVSFREHTCLHGKRSVMFNTIGQTLIVQPDEKSSYVNGEGYHPLLPEGPQLLALKHSKSRDQLLKFDPVATATITEDELEAAVDAGDGDVCSQRHLRSVSSTEEAYWELMNSPHPLRILGNRAAYGDNGSISRYHNPSNYTKALGGVLKSRIGRETILDRVGILNLRRQRGDINYRPCLDPECRNSTIPL